MMKSLAKLFRKGGLATYTVRYYSADVGASWTFDDECLDDPSLQVVYKRSKMINGDREEDDFWLYLTPEDAAAIGAILTAWGLSHGENGE